MAANTLGESKCGKQNQSIDPFMPTSAAVRMFPMMPMTYHFANIVSKLGVLNRHEAIAKSIAQGVIRMEL